MITCMTDKPDNVTDADRRSLDPVTRWLVLALPVAFLAHDVGEVRGNADLNRALAELSARIPLARRLASSVATTDKQTAAAVGVLTAGCSALALRAARQPAPGPATGEFAAATAIIGGHIVVHVAQSILLRRRMPGLLGGLAVTLPYSVLLLQRMGRRGYLETGQTARNAAFGTVAAVPALAALRLLARRLF
jgi:hypothetical protein